MFMLRFCTLHSVLGRTMHEKCPNMEFWWSVFSCFWTEYKNLRTGYCQYISDWFSTSTKTPHSIFSLRESVQYLEFFWSVFCHIWNQYRHFQYISTFNPNAGIFFNYAVFDQNTQDVNMDNKRTSIKNGFFKKDYKDKK